MVSHTTYRTTPDLSRDARRSRRPRRWRTRSTSLGPLKSVISLNCLRVEFCYREPRRRMLAYSLHFSFVARGRLDKHSNKVAVRRIGQEIDAPGARRIGQEMTPQMFSTGTFWRSES